MKKIKVLFIAPYEGLKNLVVSMFMNDEHFDVDAYVGDLEAGVALVKELRAMNYDVIISRGGTAELIELTAEIPVIDIELSQYDILHAIKLSQSYSGKIAIAGFPKIIERVESICGLLNYNMDISVINSAGQVSECLVKLKEKGCSLVIGDTITVATAKEMQMNGVLITSGSESVLSAFVEAEKICGVAEEARRRARLYEDMLDLGEFFVLVFDVERRLVFSNRRNPPEGADSPAIEAWCRAAAREIFKKGEGSFIRKSGGFLWNITGRRGNGEFDGLVYFYVRRGFDIINMVNAIQVCSAVFNKPAANSSFYDNPESTQKIVEHIRRLGKTNLSVIIFGEPGTGKDTAAFEIYRCGTGGDKAFLTIDCRMLGDRQLDYLLRSEKSPLLEGGRGIYFKRIDALGEDAQKMLVIYVRDSLLHRRNRVIYSCEANFQETPDDLLISCLLGESGQECMTLRLPSLRERASDIPSIASIYINDLNIVLGKQVAGLDPVSTEMLREFQWRSNITQLKNVLRELVLITDGAFIRGSDTERVLQKEEFYRNKPVSRDFLKGTLEEITLNVINGVLAEEGMNQSNAAKRLEISRSTLWRKLQGGKQFLPKL